MHKNDVAEVVGGALGTNGEGIASLGGYTLFVPDLLPGEKALVRILKIKGNICYARVEELLIPAEERVRPVCPVFLKCGGCQLQHMRYRSQLRFKTELVAAAFKKIAGIEAEVKPCERSEKDYGYRNKLSLPVGKLNGKNAIGFFAERTHRIVKTDECPIHPEWSKPLIAALYRFMDTCGLDGYDEETGKGQIRHIVVREMRGRFLVTLVTTVPRLMGIDYFLYLLGEIFPEFSLYLCCHTGRDNVILGGESVLLKGKGSYECSEAGICFEAGANTFVQVNENIRGKLYEKAVSLADEKDVVVDCYSGGGLLTAMFARKCRRAYGIEVVKEASDMAETLSKRNGLGGKMINICGRVEDALASVLDREKEAMLVLDPPRAGVERSVLKEVLRHGIKKILFISCNPATLARDVGILTGSLAEDNSGALVKEEDPHTMYTVSLIQPYDMFPQTKHVETLVLLERNN